ncbi:fructosamine kinase family protein [Chitinibacter bivalviorum]|uniref:Fructosamine kinase family protein n=1 Tax=Chitinibacter bivalviorum TaxID=2739434 RepID=A0A7H9BKQ5_9NEIS|nr:fructosamine kinase family protein [Chitinibacter bivalviorum]QLG89153.1 fructosamine kinase family protein [Chitinibacter bivalviorum]
MSNLITDLESAITSATGAVFHVKQQRSVGGGCINEAFVISDRADSTRQYFVKTNRAALHHMFVAEAAGLVALGEGMRVPQPIADGVSGAQAWLVLEYLPMAGSPDPESMGAALARVHRITPTGLTKGSPRFGWDIDNTIGSTPQSNRWNQSWIDFWRDERLLPQFKLARHNGCDFGAAGAKLLDKLPEFFRDYTPQPSLLHGDLWGGNAAGLADGTPVIFDPACYFGDRECDLAMTELFGGFGPRFMAAYHAAWPIDAGYAQRKTLYNLYHIINHVNLFGSGYEGQARQMIATLLRA